MIPNISAPQSAQITPILTRSAALTADQHTALRTLMTTSPRYQAQMPAQVFTLVNAAYTTPNPAQQGTVPVTTMPKEVFLHAISDLLFRVGGLPDSPGKQQILATAQTQLPLAMAAENVSLTGLAVQAIFSQLVALGVVTQAQVAALTTQPDPAYKATLPHDPDAWEITGPASLLEMSDIVAALVG